MDHSEKIQREIHPRAKANFISRVSFWYVIELFWKTVKKNKLEEDDLYEVLKTHRAQYLGEKLEKHLKRDIQRYGEVSIYRILWSCYGNEYLYLGIVQLFMRTVVVVMIPKLLAYLVSYFQSDAMPKSDAVMAAVALILLNLVNVTYLQNYLLDLSSLGIKIRTAFCSLMYKKCLQLTASSLSEITAGKIITLMTKDVGAFETIILYANDVWIGFVQSGIVCYLIYEEMGLSAFVGTGFFLLVIPFQIYLGKLTSQYRLASSKKTDERLQMTQETLYNIKLIKMNVWERFFERRIFSTRRTEVKTIVKVFLTKTAVVLIGALTSKIAFYLLVMTYLGLGNSVSATLMYYLLVLFQRIRHALSVVIPKGITESADLYAAVQRIETLLKADTSAVEVHTKCLYEKPSVDLQNVTVSLEGEKVFESLTFSVKSGLTVVTGPTGSGKSILLKTVLGDYSPDSGSVEVNGSISYSAQEPWIFPSTIRQNIVFDETFDQVRYDEVLRICAFNFDIANLYLGDNLTISDKGINLSKGQRARINLARAVYKDSDIYLLDDCLSSLDAHIQEYVFTECITKFLSTKICVLITQNPKFVKRCDNLLIMGNDSSHFSNKISDDFIYGSIEEEFEEDEVIEETNNEETKLLNTTAIAAKQYTYKEAKKSGKVDLEVYKKYVAFGGGVLKFIFIVIIFIMSHICRSYTDKLISNWVNLENSIAKRKNENSNLTRFDVVVASRYFVVLQYSLATLMYTLLSIVTAFLLFNFTRKASNGLHNTMVTAIAKAEAKFFDTHFSANILNRFSKDLTVVDEQLPFLLFDFLEVLFGLCGIIILISLVHVTFLIPVAILAVVLYLIRKLYMPTGRNLQRLDVATRSPIIGYLNATLDGLTTIRAFGAQKILNKEFNEHQDLYTSANYTSVCCTRAFALFLDTFCTVFIAVVIFRFLYFDKDTSVGDVGLAITQAFMLSGLVQYGIRQLADLENKMTCVERVLEYTNINQEDCTGRNPMNWPSKGSIIFKNVTLLYNNADKDVLKDISFEIGSQEKIGIVGRTGAGKSSIISTLFRLYSYEGKITVDNVDIKEVSLDFLRQQISVIPQDPLLFSGTLRDNIDPLKQYNDNQIWKALEKVKLKSSITSLEAKINEGGSNWSAGEKQLVCFARAIIGKTKIIILDESNANMDGDMDAVINEIISDVFLECTVIIIAHKLQSVLGCDKVMVVDAGRIVEYDSPKNLMNDEKSVFNTMIKSGIEK